MSRKTFKLLYSLTSRISINTTLCTLFVLSGLSALCLASLRIYRSERKAVLITNGAVKQLWNICSLYSCQKKHTEVVSFLKYSRQLGSTSLIYRSSDEVQTNGNYQNIQRTDLVYDYLLLPVCMENRSLAGIDKRWDKHISNWSNGSTCCIATKQYQDILLLILPV